MFSRETELSILYELSSLSARLRNIVEVIDLALDKAMRLIGAEVAILYLKTEKDDQLSAVGARGIQVSKVYSPLPLTDTVELYGRTHAWTSPESFPYPHDPLLGRYPVQTTLGVGIRYENTLHGWLYVGRIKLPFFDPRQVALYNALSDQVASALELIRSHERDKQQREALTVANQRLEELLTQQQQTIRELSTPVLKVSNNIILLPLIGRIDPERSSQIMETMLMSISTHQASVVILDITGVANVDALVANVLMQAARAAKMLGAQVVLCGVQPMVANVLISLDIHLGTLKVTNDLQTAIGFAFARVSAATDGTQQSIGWKL